MHWLVFDNKLPFQRIKELRSSLEDHIHNCELGRIEGVPTDLPEERFILSGMRFDISICARTMFKEEFFSYVRTLVICMTTSSW